jgi:hypothetical protein
MSIKKVVVFFTTNPTKFSLQFSVFSTNFYEFYKFLQKVFTIADPFYTRVPRNLPGLTDRPLICTKHLARRSGLAIEPLAMRGSGLTGIPAAPAALPAGKRRGVEHKLT